MQTNLAEPDFDVVIVGSGVAGALAAYRLAQSNMRVLILEAGGVAPDSLGRYALVRSFIGSPTRRPIRLFAVTMSLRISRFLLPQSTEPTITITSKDTLETSSSVITSDWSADRLGTGRGFMSGCCQMILRWKPCTARAWTGRSATT